jgi:hypothetical protein
MRCPFRGRSSKRLAANASSEWTARAATWPSASPVRRFVDGSGIDDHGDAQRRDGLCNKIRKALVGGHLQNGRFVAEEFRLLASPDSPATLLSKEDVFLEGLVHRSRTVYRADFGGVDWDQARSITCPGPSPPAVAMSWL